MSSSPAKSAFTLKAFALAGAAFAALLIGAAPASANCSARFSCNFGDSPNCFFTIKSGGRFQNISVQAGGSRMLYGLQPGAIFCTSNQSYPNPNACNIRNVNLSCN